MIVQTRHRPVIHCSVHVLYKAGVLQQAATIGALQRIAEHRPDLARKVMEGHELTMISPRGDEFTVSRGD